MSNLEIRTIAWDLDGVPFLWNPDQPRFAILLNQISFLAIGFERYICRATRKAETQITDPEIAAESMLFRKQEAVHSAAHKTHVKALIKQYPGLQSTLTKVIQIYDDLYDAHPLEFALAHSGGLEAIFTPFFKMVLDNRAVLFGGGDPRVVSLFLWHFCEEIEHRSSALAIYNHLVGDYGYRLRNTRRFMKFSKSLVDMLLEDFKVHVPDVPESCFKGDPFASVPLSSKLRSTFGIFASQAPWHNPERQPLPDYYQEWLGHWNNGDDVTRLYGNAALLPEPPVPAG
ncbi:hypothetical protein DB30_04637 [Enhygromyxa salina]|uniref:Metal-dependent hydrolase n=1 Tax=Enhygromyxa salina TaxID=215803 RepID=A0A0C2DHJ7_9BACT|nr:metal-dependent hydrolase [Enhygromyxa salina]KIG19172.1 hypothetical protein DB30_04637 [Enhygromyxa salina]